MRTIVLIVGLLAAFVSFSAVAAMTDIYDSPYYSEGGGGSGLWILLIPIIAFVLFYGGKTGRNGLAWVVGMCAGAVAVLIGSMYLGNMLLGRPVSKEASWLGLMFFCGIWFGGLKLWAMSGHDKDTPTKTKSETPKSVSSSDFYWGLFGLFVIGGQVYSYIEKNKKQESATIAAVTQQGQPPIQTNPGGGLPPCIGTKAATWTNCTGTANWPDGGTYAGEWGGGKMHGQGTRTLPDGAKYIGEYRDDTPHGQGTLTGPDGQKYVGKWRSGKMHGQGTHTWPDGQKYVGEYKDGMPNGQGTHTWPDGKKYVGEFRDDKFNGQGTLMFPDGAKFVGEYKDGERNGQGTLTLPDGSVGYSGMWADGAPVE